MLYTVPKKLFAKVLSCYIKDIPRDGIVLDIGCGLGDLTRFVTENLKRRTVGLDVDHQTCYIAVTNTRDLFDSEIILSGGTSLPFKEEAFHLIYAHEVIEHIDDDEFFLKEACRVLRKGGLLILSTPNAAKEPFNKSFHSDHVRHYTKSDITTKLTDSGLFVVATYWRYHTIGAFIDSLIYRFGIRLLHPKQVQPTMSSWSGKSQSKLIRLMLHLYKYIIDPLVIVIVLIEFQLMKTRIEAANMVIVCRK